MTGLGNFIYFEFAIANQVKCVCVCVVRMFHADIEDDGSIGRRHSRVSFLFDDETHSYTAQQVTSTFNKSSVCLCGYNGSGMSRCVTGTPVRLCWSVDL